MPGLITLNYTGIFIHLSRKLVTCSDCELRPRQSPYIARNASSRHSNERVGEQVSEVRKVTWSIREPKRDAKSLVVSLMRVESNSLRKEFVFSYFHALILLALLDEVGRVIILFL
jgi:hypothetical protein